ncbi:MAG: hypothetical protein MHPDNHAH_00555 [Anaerolineales bacterium]|nr:hypothetical protein [Anaerolineales bacterium]WKZ49505.1 MAG: CPBP family intramembrane metalloprotease [Anaerolineales bacterium]
MKTWTKQQALTYILLFALLLAALSRGLFNLIVGDLLDPSFEQIYEYQLRSMDRILFSLYWFGELPVIVFVIKLNRDQLQRLNVDRLFVFMLVTAGLIQLYKYPFNIFNIFAVIALVYAVQILFDKKVSFGVVDQNGLRMILLIAGVLAGITFCATGFFHNVKLELPDTELFDRFLIQIVPGSIYEEAVYRGILYMFLTDLGVSKSKAFYIQAFAFWIVHMGNLFVSPSYFWLILPIHSLIYGYIAMRTKSLTSSAIAHLLYNTWALLS